MYMLGPFLVYLGFRLVFILPLLDHLKKFQHCCAQEQGTRSAPPTKPRQLSTTNNNNGLLSVAGQQQQLPPHTAKRESFLVEQQQTRPVSQNQTVQIGTISHDLPQTIKFESNPVTVQTSLAQAIHQLQPQTIIGQQQQQQMQNQSFQSVASYRRGLIKYLLMPQGEGVCL